MDIPDSLRLALGWGLIACAVALVAFLWWAHLGHNADRRAAGQPTKSAARHVRDHAGHHIVASVWAALGVALLLGLGGAALLLHHGGGVLVPGRHITPPRHRVAGGPVPDGYVSPDLAAYTRPDDRADDQRDTLACCAVTTVRLDSLNRAISRGEYAAPLYPTSGYRPWWYATAGQNIGTDPLDDVAALNSHGGEPLYYWGPHGHPDSTDPAHTISLGNASVTWQSYNAGGIGRAGLDDLEWRLDHKQPVGLLWAVHYDGDHAYGLTYTWDGGSFSYYHCVVVVAWAKDLSGAGESVKIWNSYGTGYGQGGLIWLPAAVVERHGLGTFTEQPGHAVTAWLPPTPTPVPTARPTARPTATPRPVACITRRYTMAHDANARAVNKTSAPPLFGLSRGMGVTSVCENKSSGASTHWLEVVDFTQRIGWVLRSTLKAA